MSQKARQSEPPPPAKTPRRERLAAAVVFGSMVLVAAAVAWYGKAAVPGTGEEGVVVFELTGVGASGVWTTDEVNGLNYWWKEFEPATLYVREGDEVVINLRSADLFHNFYIPGFQVGPVDVEPGHMATVRFRAEHAGVYQYYCTSMCGTCHFYMRGWLVVTAAGEEPVHPPRIVCQRCLPDEADDEALPEELLARGALLYLDRGCVTCHGPEGQGGVPNPNSTIETPPAHDTTAQKLFLASEEDAEALIELVRGSPDLDALDEPPEISRYPIVRARWDNAEQIIRTGRYTAKLDPDGPEPPLQMPAWQHLLDERDIDALLAYFVSLYDWEVG